MLNVFIDAQIWLSLYSFSQNNLNQFSKLKDCIKNNEVKIFLTEQIIDEVYRNRENKLKDVLKQTQSISFNIPVLYHGYEKEYDEFQKSFDNTQKLNGGLQKKINKDIVAQNLPQDILIKELFEMSQKLKTSSVVFDRAITRFRLIGDPPGKDDKCGDAISWETLLEDFADKEDLFLISSDKDYKSVLDETRLNQYLKNEWELKKQSKIFFYNSLPDFFSKNLKDIKLESIRKQDNLISELAKSGNFERTHSIIAKMSVYNEWTIEQVERICAATRENSQIYWILQDTAIYNFFDKLVEPLLLEKNDENIIWVQQKLWNKDK